MSLTQAPEPNDGEISSVLSLSSDFGEEHMDEILAEESSVLSSETEEETKEKEQAVEAHVELSPKFRGTWHPLLPRKSNSSENINERFRNQSSTRNEINVQDTSHSYIPPPPTKSFTERQTSLEESKEWDAKDMHRHNYNPHDREANFTGFNPPEQKSKVYKDWSKPGGTEHKRKEATLSEDMDSLDYGGHKSGSEEEQRADPVSRHSSLKPEQASSMNTTDVKPEVDQIWDAHNGNNVLSHENFEPMYLNGIPDENKDITLNSDESLLSEQTNPQTGMMDMCKTSAVDQWNEYQDGEMQTEEPENEEIMLNSNIIESKPKVTILTSTYSTVLRTDDLQHALRHMLEAYEIEFEEVDGALTFIPGNIERREELFKISGHRGVYPQLFIDDIFVGLFDRVVELNEKGSLKRLLRCGSPSYKKEDS